ncbi:histone-like nucleoid-structuring protein Lsr2 [Rathayibacter tanaceti]
MFVDDVDGTPVDGGGATVRFSGDGNDCRIDLSADDTATVHTALDTFVAGENSRDGVVPASITLTRAIGSVASSSGGGDRGRAQLESDFSRADVGLVAMTAAPCTPSGLRRRARHGQQHRSSSVVRLDRCGSSTT